MMETYLYKVSGFRFSVQVPAGVDLEELLPSFRPFGEEEAGEELFRLEAYHASLPEDASGEVWEEAMNDMGFTRLIRTENGYRMVIRYTEQGAEHTLCANRRFTRAQAAIDWNDPYAGQVLCSLLRMVYAQAVVYHQAISIHASVVMLEGQGFLFMGKSGTGKSTHSAWWQKTFEGCELLNDDNPTIRLREDGVRVYGTPWSGKTSCYQNKSCLLAGMVRLRQAKVNRFMEQKDIQAFITVLPGCSVIRKDAEQYDALCATLVALTGQVKTGVLDCLPNKEAAQLCRSAFKQE